MRVAERIERLIEKVPREGVPGPVDQERHTQRVSSSSARHTSNQNDMLERFSKLL